jgi:hypothetical protein
MAKRETAQAAGLIAGFWNKVEDTMFFMGGTHAHMAMLAQDDARHAIEEMVKTAIREFFVPFELVGEPATFGEAIQAGNYDQVSGLAGDTKEYGAALGNPLRVNRKVYLFNQNATSRVIVDEVYRKFGKRIAGLPELLLFGSNHPKIQLFVSVHAIWLDASGRYWRGSLESVDGERHLDIVQVPENATCHGAYRGQRLLFTW